MIKDIFFSPQYRGFAFLSYIAYVFIFTVFYERFLEKIICNKLKFLNNRDKKVMFGVFLTGFTSLLMFLFIKSNGFRIHYFWWAIGFLIILGGVLGFVPLSFTEKRKHSK